MSDSTRLTIPVPDGELPVHLWLPDGGEGPGVVVIQEIFGVSRYLRRRASDLADLGYVVMAPELFWRLGADAVPEGPDMLAQGMSLSSRFDWSAGVADTVATLHALRALPEQIGRCGVLGFCFGGGMAFNVAAVDSPDALVAYYGSALPRLLDLAPEVAAPSLHHFGTADAFLDASTVARITEALEPAGARIELHEGAGHAFDNADFTNFHAVASGVAWAQTVAFLSRYLRS